MSELSKKYGDPTNEEAFLFFTRDVEFTKVVVYQNGKVVQTIEDMDALQTGMTFTNASNQAISVKLLHKMSFKLLVVVDGTDYAPMKPEKETPAEPAAYTRFKESNMRPLALAFGIALAVQLLNFMQLGDYAKVVTSYNWSQPVQTGYIMEILILIIVAYAVTIYILHDNRGWAYFIGAPILLIYTGFELYSFYEFKFTYGLSYPMSHLVPLFLKTIVSLYVLFQFKRVITNISSSETQTDTHLLDVE